MRRFRCLHHHQIEIVWIETPEEGSAPWEVRFLATRPPINYMMRRIMHKDHLITKIMHKDHHYAQRSFDIMLNVAPLS